MKLVLIFVSVTILGVSGQVINPWVDNSDCLPTDTPVLCSTKKKQCAPISNVINPPGAGGLIGSITSCANATGTTMDPTIYSRIGLSYAQGKPEMLLEGVSLNSTADLLIRFCVLNLTGLIGSDFEFNRTAAVLALSKQLLGPMEGIAVLGAAITCPDPVNYVVEPFMSCLRKACMTTASGTTPGAFTGGKKPMAGTPPKLGMTPYGSPGFGGGFYGAPK